MEHRKRPGFMPEDEILSLLTDTGLTWIANTPADYDRLRREIGRKSPYIRLVGNNRISFRGKMVNSPRVR